MSKLNIAQNGDHYFARSYPVRGDKGEDMIFRNCKVYPSGEALFSAAGFRGGEEIPKEVFY